MPDQILDKIEENAEMLRSLDSDRFDHTLTKTEYDSFQDRDLLKKLIGGKSFSDWDDFKTKFIEYQEDKLGFCWIRKQGQGGPLKLQEVNLPPEVGTGLAKRAMQKGKDKGEFIEFTRKELPKLDNYVNKSQDEKIYIDYKKYAYDRFKDYSENNEGFKFQQGRGDYFEKSKLVYKYKGKDTRKGEIELGKLIIKNNYNPRFIKDMLKLTELVHEQENRGFGKLQNVDLIGIKINPKVGGDSVSMYTFELKATNSIQSVSEAITQAVNYRGKSHYTYIVIPMFDGRTFHDGERMEEFLDMCRINKIGVISIDIEDGIEDEDKVVGVTKVLDAPQTPLEDSECLLKYLEKHNYEMCPLCRKIVKKDDRSERCGWKDNDGNCMKDLMEDMLSKSAEENQTSSQQ